MTSEERLAATTKKLEAFEHQKLLQDNQNQKKQKQLEVRRVFLIGKLFIEHFPIVLELMPGKTSEDDTLNFKPLDDFMKALSEFLQAYQSMEDAIIRSRQN